MPINPRKKSIEKNEMCRFYYHIIIHSSTVVYIFNIILEIKIYSIIYIRHFSQIIPFWGL